MYMSIGSISWWYVHTHTVSMYTQDVQTYNKNTWSLKGDKLCITVYAPWDVLEIKHAP